MLKSDADPMESSDADDGLPNEARALRIAINALSARVGGGQTYLRHLLARLPADPELRIALFAPASLDVGNDPRIERFSPGFPVANPISRAIWERLAFPRFLKRWGAQVLFCPGGVVATDVPSACRVATMFRNMIPFDPVARARLPFGWQRLRNAILERVMLRSMAQTDLTIFISEYARSIIEAKVRVPRALTIPHGIDARFRNQGTMPPRPDGAPHGPYWLYVSKFENYKHQSFVAAEFAALDAAVRGERTLILLGDHDAAEYPSACAVIQKARIEGCVQMPGGAAYSELPAWYAHAEAILFASSCENCPNILLESLGAGRPVMCSDVMPMPEFGGDAVIYFTPEVERSLTSIMSKIVNDQTLRGQLGELAIARSREYDWDMTCKSTWEALETLANHSSRGAADPQCELEV